MSAKRLPKSLFFRLFPVLGILLLPLFSSAQAPLRADSTLNEATLESTIAYALRHNPVVQQAYVDERITRQQIRSRLADWYPQINVAANLQRNFVLPSNVIGGNIIRFGVTNTSNIQLTGTQNIFNPDVLLAARTKEDVLLLAGENTQARKIDLVVNVSKAFYSVLLSQQQIRVSESDIVRNRRSLQDAKARYEAGINDKIDYKRATISLNNALATQTQNKAQLEAKVVYLKALMDYPESAPLPIVYDSLKMEQEAVEPLPVTQDYASTRIELLQLRTRQRLLEYNITYNRWKFIPTLSAFGAYNYNFQNNQFADLYGRNFPSSFAGLTLGVPLFTGGKRLANLQIARLDLVRNTLDIQNLENNISASYRQALANYQSSAASYEALKENLALAQEVYEVVDLQYRAGIKAYLEVVQSEADLRFAQINYYNALYQLLAARVDVNREAGAIVPE
jgi:outer membrane protein TolC